MRDTGTLWRRAIALGLRVVRLFCTALGFLVLCVLLLRLVPGQLHVDLLVTTVPSPDGRFLAEVYRSEQAFDAEYKVVLRSRSVDDGRTVLAYEAPLEIRLQPRWVESDTLRILVPCVPPQFVRPVWHAGSEARWRVIVEAVPADPRCRYARGAAPPGGFPQEQ